MGDEEDVTVAEVTVADAGELLTLRRAAFVSEAQTYNDPHIPALTQTLDELIADLTSEGVITLGARRGHRLLGSIRVGIEGDKATLGRLAVAPVLDVATRPVTPASAPGPVRLTISSFTTSGRPKTPARVA